MAIYAIGFVPGEIGLPGFGTGFYKISFSVSPKAVCNLDGADLSSNVGTNQRIFFHGRLDGGVTVSKTVFPVSDNDADGRRRLSFIYDPSQGNLLMTVEVSGKPPADLSSKDFQGVMFRAPECQGSSRAYDFPSFPGGHNSDNVGLVTIFSYIPMFTSTGDDELVPSHLRLDRTFAAPSTQQLPPRLLTPSAPVPGDVNGQTLFSAPPAP
jgi:hypothetical protein